MSELPAEIAGWPIFHRADSAAAKAFLARDWSSTALGPIAGWSTVLRAMVSMVLHADQPMLLYWGPELVQLYNDGFIPSFGRDRHPGAMGQRASDCWSETWPTVGVFVDRVMAEGASSWFEDALLPIHRNGRFENVWWTFGYSPIHDADGTVGGCLVVVTETTGRIMAQRRLMALQHLSRATASALSVPDLFSQAAAHLGRPETVDFAFVILFPSNGGAAVLGGLQPDQLDLEALQNRLQPGTVPVEVQVEGYPWTEPVTSAAVIEIPGEPRSVATLVVGLSPRLSYDHDYGSFVDQVAEQLAAEVRRIEAYRVRSLVEAERNELLLQAPIATALTIGPTHVFRLANPRYIAMAGGRDLLGKAYLEAFPELLGQPLLDTVDTVFHSGVPFSIDEMHAMIDLAGTGTPTDHWFRFALQPMRIDGQVQGLMAVAIDITTQVATRKALEAAQEERMRLVADLEDANRAKDEFLAMLGHELRNPLSPILTATELLRIREVPGIDIERDIIERQVRHMVRLVDDLLDISRITRGKLQLERVQLDVDDVVERALEQVRPLLAQRDHTLVLETSTGLLVEGDASRLAQVLCNLLVNAARYTPPGGDLRVQTRREDDQIVLRVLDNGDGIAPERIESLFVAFAQGRRTLQGAGLGLGLAIVRSLVEAHGGTITLTSAGLGQGTTAEVRLPRACTPPDDAGVDSDVGSPATPPLTVWLVDDNVDAAVTLSMALQALGHTVRITHDAPSILVWAMDARPDVALLDLGLPGMDGYALAASLRDLDGWASVPLIALTGFGQTADRDRTAHAGFAAHLVKPVDLDLISTTLRTLHAHAMERP